MILAPLAFPAPAVGVVLAQQTLGGGLCDGWTVWIVLGVGLLMVGVAVDLTIRYAVVRFSLPFFEAEPPFNLVQEPIEASAKTLRVTVPGASNDRGGPLTLAVAAVPAHGETRGIVVFCPETGGSRWFWRRYISALPPAGFAVVCFDQRGTYDSDTDPSYPANYAAHWPTEAQVEDTLAVTRAVLDDPGLFGLPTGRPTALYGISRGACAALATAAREPRVLAVAADGGFVTDSVLVRFSRRWAMLAVPKWMAALLPTWHIRQSVWYLRKAADRKKGIRHLALQHDLPQLKGRPVWLVSGSRDSYVVPEQTAEIAEAVGVEPWLVKKAKHNQSREIAGAEYDARLTAFFSDAVARAL